MPCCTPEVLLSEQSAIAEFPLSFCYLFVPISHRDLYLTLVLLQRSYLRFDPCRVLQEKIQGSIMA